jgi:hypothetical protein
VSQSSVSRLGTILVVGAFLAFCLVWWNRSLNPTIAGDLFIAFAHRHGWIPYRDFYSAAPPGMFLLGIAIPALFGDHLIAFWAFGLVLRALSVGVLYVWLRRQFHPVVAAAAVLAGAIVSCGDITDYPYFYHHVAFAFATFGAAALAKSLDRRDARWAFAAGLLLALNSLIKQTTGIFITAAVVAWAAVALWRSRERRALGRLFAAGVAGFALPWALTLAWLRRAGVLGAFVDTVFLSGTAAKGTPGATLLRPIVLTASRPDLRAPALVAIAILALALVLPRLPLERAKPFLAVAAVVGAAFAALFGLLGPDSRLLALAGCYLALIGNLAVVVRRFVRRPSRRGTQIGLLAALGFGSAYSLSISWPAFEVMVFPGLPLLIALAISAGGRARSVVRPLVVAACVAAVIATSAHKAVHPGGFGAWEEPPIATADTQPSLPELAGFILNRGTADFYDVTTALIREHSRPDERIFVYPIFPEFYALAERLPATFAIAHLLDICPDPIAAADGARLLASPPAVMVVQRLTEPFYVNSEAMFRGGRRSGQREIQHALATLAPRYRVVGSARAPGTGVPIEVWALKR